MMNLRISGLSRNAAPSGPPGYAPPPIQRVQQQADLVARVMPLAREHAAALQLAFIGLDLCTGTHLAGNATADELLRARATINSALEEAERRLGVASSRGRAS